MQIALLYGLPFVRVILRNKGRSSVLDNVLIDTGSASTLFPITIAMNLGINFALGDERHRVSGVGGAEWVYPKRVDAIRIGDAINGPLLRDFEVEVGAMEYGFPLDGIIGMDLLRRIGATLDLDSMTLTSTRSD